MTDRQRCQGCDKFLGLTRQRYCGQRCRQRAYRKRLGAAPDAPSNWYPTALNIETTARYQACVDAGTHVSGSTLTADYRPWDAMGDVRFACCDTCGVPITGEKVMFRLHARQWEAA